MPTKIVIDNEKKKVLIEEIQIYFLKEREEEIGELAATFLLDFFCEKIGPEFYNQGVFDAYRYMQNATEDLLGIQK